MNCRSILLPAKYRDYMTYWGGGHYGYEICPTCGYGMLNGICYNTDGHRGAGGTPTSTPSYTSSNAPVVELGIEIGKLVKKWWDKRQANKRKEEKIVLRYPESTIHRKVKQYTKSRSFPMV